MTNENLNIKNAKFGATIKSDVETFIKMANQFAGQANDTFGKATAWAIAHGDYTILNKMNAELDHSIRVMLKTFVDTFNKKAVATFLSGKTGELDIIRATMNNVKPDEVPSVAMIGFNAKEGFFQVKNDTAKLARKYINGAFGHDTEVFVSAMPLIHKAVAAKHERTANAEFSACSYLEGVIGTLIKKIGATHENTLMPVLQFLGDHIPDFADANGNKRPAMKREDIARKINAAKAAAAADEPDDSNVIPIMSGTPETAVQEAKEAVQEATAKADKRRRA